MEWKRILDSATAGSPEEKPLINSPAYENLGLPRLQNWGEGWASALWEFDRRMSNSRGELFGGFYGVLSDGVLALTAMTVLENHEVFKTIDLRVSLFRPVSGGIVDIRGKVVSRNRSYIYLEAEFRDEKERLLAKSAAVQAVFEAGAGDPESRFTMD